MTKQSLNKTYKLRLSPTQRHKLSDIGKRTGLTDAQVIRTWIDDRQVIERVPLFDREILTSLQKISGMAMRSFSVLDTLDMLNRSKFTSEMALEAAGAYRELRQLIDTILKRL